VPWFARYAYEVYILPKRQASSLADLSLIERRDLAALMREMAIRYDNLWRRPMPYVMALHQAPTDDQDYSAFPFHIEYHPPLRKPDTMKYLAGPEVGGGSMTNESNPDEKAAELRAAASNPLGTSSRSPRPIRFSMWTRLVRRPLRRGWRRSGQPTKAFSS
jgi:UDPglucose--hexose-1-phosphate uridylyltransferase